MKRKTIAAALIGAVAVTTTRAADAPKMKMTTDIPKSNHKAVTHHPSV